MAGLEEYQAAVAACAICVGILRHHDLRGILTAIDTAEAVGPILDARLFSEKSRAMEEDKNLLKAALALREVLEAGR